jgi:hypothetical protein
MENSAIQRLLVLPTIDGISKPKYAYGRCGYIVSHSVYTGVQVDVARSVPQSKICGKKNLSTQKQRRKKTSEVKPNN